jgi:hypothetical protein
MPRLSRLLEERAEQRSLLMAFSIARSKPSEPPPATIGTYADEYVRTPTGWRTGKVKFLLGARFNYSDNARLTPTTPVHLLAGMLRFGTARFHWNLLTDVQHG